MGAVTTAEAPVVAAPRTGAGAGLAIGLKVQVYIIPGVQARQVREVVRRLPTGLFHAAHLGRPHLVICHLTEWNYNVSPIYYLCRNSLCRCSILSWLLIEALGLERKELP